MDNMNRDLFILDECTGEVIQHQHTDTETVACDDFHLDECSGVMTPIAVSSKTVLSNITNVTGVKRKKNPEKWQRNIRKNANLAGVSHIRQDGTIKAAKAMREICSSCRLKCYERITEVVRQQFYMRYYSLSSSGEKYSFLLKFTRTTEKKRNNKENRRSFTRTYFIGTGDYENGAEKTVNVCKTTFFNTLGITDQSLRTAYDKLKTGNEGNLRDLRGTVMSPISDLKQLRKSYVLAHMKSFPLMESHYCRANNSKQYLSSDLTVKKMYDLYLEKMEEDQMDSSLIVSLKIYEHTFVRDTELSFNKIKKDACDVCVAFQNAPQHIRTSTMLQHKKHLSMKDAARHRKNQHKLDASASERNIIAAVYDFEKGIQIPRAEASSFYYKRKLTVHNFTIYDLTSKKSNNYCYDESLSGVGPNEVCSCLWMYINEKIKEHATDFRFISDNCRGQNKNRFVFFFYAYCSATFHVDISHTFLVHGHTENEGDSVHSTIERGLKKQSIFVPDEFYEIIKTSSRKNKHNVIKVDVENLLNFKVVHFFLIFTY